MITLARRLRLAALALGILALRMQLLARRADRIHWINRHALERREVVEVVPKPTLEKLDRLLCHGLDDYVAKVVMAISIPWLC